ncbi:MAG TPA: glycosyltransferase family 2 protein [Candidatus Limnocylindrales bacterium]|nr:glycosyltransferase family 2 protein [Candidatus Limnocylindrales bacterium]
MSKKEKLLSIIIPVFNEESTIGNVIDRVKAAADQTGLKNEVIVVDDFSNDSSLEKAEGHGARLYALKMHLGKGYALRVGFAKAKGDIVVTIDSDGSHQPEELPELLLPILKNRADLVIGSRYLNHKKVATKQLNAFGVEVFNSLIDFLAHVAITDSQSGYRAMARKILRSQTTISRGYEIESEMLVKAAKRRFRIVEVPISFEQRTYGRSGVDPVFDGIRILLSIFLAYMWG